MEENRALRRRDKLNSPFMKRLDFCKTLFKFVPLIITLYKVLNTCEGFVPLSESWPDSIIFLSGQERSSCLCKNRIDSLSLDAHITTVG
jgi:hypothetical protein